jgi:hypothetical protein
MKTTVFWDVALCNLIETDRRFRDAVCTYQITRRNIPKDSRLEFHFAFISFTELSDAPQWLIHGRLTEARKQQCCQFPEDTLSSFPTHLAHHPHIFRIVS